MFRYLRSAPKVLRSCLAPRKRRPSRKEEFLRPLQLEKLEDRSLLAGVNLNEAITILLADFSQVPPSQTQEFTYADVTVGSSVGGGTADIDLKNVTLKFPDLAFDAGAGKWTGNVTVEAQTGVLFPGLLNVAITDDGTDIAKGNDADLFGVVGSINVALNNSTSYLKLDPIDAETIGVPAFLDASLQNLRLNFTNFRSDDNLNSLHLEVALKGFDTGDAFLNTQLQTGSNPFIQISVQGFASGDLNLPTIEFAATNLATFKDALFHATLAQIDGFGGKINGKLMKLGYIKADFLFHQITVDGKTSGYIAVEGGMTFGDDAFGRSGDFEVALAISDLGPLQIFALGGPIKTPWGIEIEEARFGTIFNQTIEGLRTTIDAAAIAAEVVPEGTSSSRVTLTMSSAKKHDLVVGDHFRITGSANTAYNGDFTVATVVGDKVTYIDGYHTPAALAVLGPFTGSANIIRLTIRTPLDLRDGGITISPPRSMFDWRNQLDLQVTNQIHAGANVWNQLFGKAIFGGGATITIEGISGKLLKVNADVALDTNGGIFLSGNLSLGGGAARIPAYMYADLTKLQIGAAKFLFLADIPKITGVVHDPLLVYRGSVGFQALVNGAPIGLDPSGLPAGVGINVTSATVTGTGPWTTTFTLNMPAGTKASDKFQVGDTLVVVKSNPDQFDGEHIITAVNDTAGTISFRIGSAVKNGGIDVNLDGIINTADDGLFGEIPVIDGKLDIDRNGIVDSNDIGGVSRFDFNLATTDDLTDYQRVDYKVINGLVDIDNDGNVSADAGDVGAIGADPGTWAAGTAVANQNALGDGFRITLEGGIDLNIPEVTTISLESVTPATLDITIPGPGSVIDARMDISFDGQLREKYVGQIARFAGNFHVTLDTDIPVDSAHPVGGVEIWGAGLLTTDFQFLRPYGLIANATAVLRINSSDVVKEELLPVANQATPITVALPAKSFALRLDGSLDFRIDFDQDTVFELDESMALFNGIFVFEFSADQGFNVAIFNENAGIVGPAALQIGPPNLFGSRLLTAQTLGNLAIRSNGVAAHIYVGMSAATPSELPLDLAELSGQAVLVINTTGQPVTFKVPGASGSNRPAAGSTLVIPAAAPANPSSILGAASSATNPQFEALKTGSPTWVAQPSAGPYGVMFIKGHINLAGVLEKELAGYVLLSKNVVSMEANFKAERSFLNLASGSVSGRMFYSSQGEFELEAHGDVQLGPDGFNIAGHANLFISYLDSDLKGSAGVDPKTLIITGDLSVKATVFYVSLGTIGLDVAYKEPTLTVGVTVPVPDIAWTEPDPVFGVSWPYPTIVDKKYTFTVGTFTVNPTPPPPVYLASNMGGGVLRLNVGLNATDRNYNTEEKDEAVAISHVSAGTLSGEKILITMFGISQEYDNVTSITADMGDGNDFLSINSGVTVPVVAYLGVGTDTLTNKSTAFVTAYGEGDRDSLTGGSGIDWLYGGGGSDTIDGGVGADVIEGGTDNDFLIGGDGSDTIKGDAGQDLIAGDLGGFTGTTTGIVFSSAASASGGADTIYGGQGADIIFGGSGGDTIYGESESDTLLGGDGQATIVSTSNGSTTVVVALALGSDDADEFRWTVGNGNDIIDGQAGSDTLNIFGTDGSAEQVIVSAKVAGFTAAVGTESLSVDGVEVSSIEGGGGSDSFTVNDLTGSVLQQINLKLGSDSVQDAVVVNGSANSDVFSIAQSLSALRIQKKSGVMIDVFDTSSTSGVDTITLDTKAGADTINVQVSLVGTLTTVNGGDGGDLIQVGSNATEFANTGGNLNGIVGNLTIAGDGGVDVLSLDDTGDTAANIGTLTATQITGLGMGSTGIIYAGVETLNVCLGSGGDTFNVQGTPNGTASTIKTGNGEDNVTVNATGSGGPITLNGQADADTFNINLGSLAAIVSVGDSGASGTDALNINGLVGANNIVLDYATITSGTELVNYTGIETLRIDTHDGADAFMIKDNGAITTINSGKGEDEFTIGPAVNEDGEVIDANKNGTNTDEQAIKGTSLWMMINAGDDNDDFEVNRNTGELYLNGENGNDVFVLNTLITGGDSTVDGGGDADVITYLQNAPVHINGGNGFDTIIVNGSKLNDVFIITGTTIEVVGSRKVGYDEIESLTANGRKGLDTFTVDTTIDGAGKPLTTSALELLAVNGQQDDDLMELRGMLADIIATVSGGLGDDTFNLRSVAPLTVTVNAIDGPVTINGDDGQDTLNVYDNCDSIANTGTLTSTTLTGLDMESGVTYGSLEALRISLGKGGNTFTIKNTHTGLTFLNSGSGADTVYVHQIQGTTTVNAEAGNDTINVGCLTPSGSSVNKIAAALFVNGGGANLDTLNVDDTGDATPNDGVLTATTLTGLGMGSGITYSNLEVLNVSLGAGGNSFNVKSTAAGTATTLNSGNGKDVLTIDSNGALANGTVNCVVSSLSINGQDGINVLTMEDYSDTTGDKVHVTPTQIGAASGDTFFGTGGFLTYSELDQVTLNMSQAVSPDTIDLTPSRLGTEFFIRGRDPQTPMQRAQLPGDALYQDFTGLTATERLGVSLKATGLNNPADPVFNVWNIPGHGKVNYKQIEKMNHVQTVAVGADLGGQEPRVRVIDAETGLQKLSFLAFAAGFKGGVRVAVGDVNGDAIPDIITSAGPGGGPEVRVFNGATGARFTEPIGDFFAFQQGSNTNVWVAVADFNMDGLADIVTGSDSGDPIVKVFDSYKLLTAKANPVMSQFTAYDRHITGGARLAVGDLTGDGVPDIAAAPVSGLRSEVRIYATSLSANQATVSHSLFTSFTAFPSYNGPINIAVGDVNGDRRADVIVSTDSGGSSLARIYNGATLRSGSAPTLLSEFAPFGKQPGGVRVALVDVDGDGVNELMTASALTGSKVKPKVFRLPNGAGGLTPAAIDAVFAGYASDPFIQGALFLAGGN